MSGVQLFNTLYWLSHGTRVNNELTTEQLRSVGSSPEGGAGDSSHGNGEARGVPDAVVGNVTVPHAWQQAHCIGVLRLDLDALRQLAMEMDGPAGDEDWDGSPSP